MEERMVKEESSEEGPTPESLQRLDAGEKRRQAADEKKMPSAGKKQRTGHARFTEESTPVRRVVVLGKLGRQVPWSRN